MMQRTGWLVFLAIAAAAKAAETGAVTITNSRLAATFSTAEHGALVSFSDRLTGRELLAATQAPRLFQLEFTPADNAAGERLALTSRDAATTRLSEQQAGGRRVVTVTSTNLAGRPITVTCTVTATDDDPHLRWRLSATFPKELALDAVRFPILTLRAPLSPQADDAIVIGATKGGVYHRPSAWNAGRRLSFGQPGNLAAPFGCLYDAAGGLFTAAFDSVGHPKNLTISRTAEGLELQWYLAVRATETWSLSYDLAATTLTGTPADWRDAADLYKAWAVGQPWCARTYAQRDDLPAWLRQGPAMVRFNRAWLAHPERIDAWLEDYWRPHFPASVPLIVAFWGWEKVETWITPDYFPAYPDDERFVALNRRLRARGGHPFLWPSGYHYTLTYGKLDDGTFTWDDRARFDAEARAHAVVGRDGKVIIGDRSWLRGGQTATMCPGDPWTRHWFTRIGDEIARRGADILQVDQVVGGGFPVCYSPDHGHAIGPGPWVTEVFRQQLDELGAACRRIDPDFVLGFEEPNDLFIQQVGLQDYRDTQTTVQPGVEQASIFGYLYHEYLPCFQSNPRAGDKLMDAYCLVNGQIPHLVLSMRTGPGPALGDGGLEAWPDASGGGWDKVAGYRGEVWSGQAQRDEAIKHGGTASLHLLNAAADDVVQVSQNVPLGGGLRVGGTYRFGAWLRSGGVSRENDLIVGAFSSQMDGKGSWTIPMPRQVSDWTHGEVTFTLTDGTELLRIMLYLRGPGSLWIDDVTLAEVRPDGTAVECQRDGVPSDHALMRTWVELFAGEGRPYLLLGKMLHPPALTTETVRDGGWSHAAILHNAYEAPDGSRAVILVNATGELRRGGLTWNGARQELVLEPWHVRLVR